MAIAYTESAVESKFELPEGQQLECVEGFGRMAALGELVAGVSHSFGNVLMGVSATLELLQMKSHSNPQLADCAEAIDRALGVVDRGAQLVQCLLEFCRDMPFAIGPIDANQVADRAIALCSTHPKAKRLRLLNSIPAQLHWVSADAIRLEEILTNLVLNAMQASENGTIEIGAESSETEHWVDIYVADTGCGIPREDLHKVFWRSYSKRHDGTKGTGLGLPCCLSLVTTMNGTMSVESVVGKGSRFGIRLPQWQRSADAD